MTIFKEDASITEEIRQGVIKKYNLAGRIRVISFSLLGIFLLVLGAIGGYSYINISLAVLIVVEIFVNQPHKFFIDRVNLHRLQYYQMATDIVCISWITYYMGGVEVPMMSLAYCAVILWAGAVSTHGAVFFAASLSSVLFSSVIILESFGLLPVVTYYGYKLPPPQAAAFAAGNVAFFFAFGYFSAIASKLIMSAEKEKFRGSLKHEHRFRAASYLAGYTVHDAVNYLANIRGYADILTGKNLSDDETDILRSIGSLAAKSTEILSRLMKFSRKPAEKTELVDVNGAIEDALDLTRPLIRYSKISVKKMLDADVPGVQGERELLQEVFTALILNAYEAVTGKGELEITTAAIDGGRKVKVTFRDTGIGMDERGVRMVKSGEMFFRDDGTGRKVGLGLVTAREIINKHSGEMDVQSVPGKGTRFEIYLPVIPEEGKI